MRTYKVIPTKMIPVYAAILLLSGVFIGAWSQDESLINSNIQLHKLLGECREGK